MLASTYCANACGWPTEYQSDVIRGQPGIRSTCQVNEATSTGENQRRRAARKRYQAHYRALYDQLLEILFGLDPIGVHRDSSEKFAPEATTIMARLSEARVAEDVEQIVLEELRRWYGRRRRLANPGSRPTR